MVLEVAESSFRSDAVNRIQRLMMGLHSEAHDWPSFFKEKRYPRSKGPVLECKKVLTT